MNKALVTVLMLASSSVAMAKPATFSASASVSYGVNVHTHAADDCAPAHAPVVVAPPHSSHRPWVRPLPARPLPIVWNPNNTSVGANASTYVGAKLSVGRADRRWNRSWIPMTEPTRIDSGREFINLGTEAGRFRQIQLAETRGSSFIQQVAIEFADGGRTQVVKLARYLVPGAAITIDLDGNSRAINRVIVYGSTAHSSAYQLLGM